MSSICRECTHYADTWSEKLRQDHEGCDVLYFRDLSNKEIEEMIPIGYIAGFGWIVRNGLAVNNMLITQNTQKCSSFQKK